MNKRCFKKNRLPLYVLLMLIIITAATFLLFLASLLPQSLVMRHYVASAERLREEGPYPTEFDHTNSATLDNWTDSIILMESEAMNSDNFSSIFTNPYYGVPDGESPVDGLYKYAMGEEVNTGYYVRYWMGYRVIIRLLLCALDYYQIRRFLALALFTLFFLVNASVAKHTDVKTTFIFSLCFLFVRPQIICSTIQFSTCFFIAFAGMLAVPWVYKNPRYEAAFFMLLGAVTMYFDFYTSPLVTMGFPYVYLALMKCRNGRSVRVKNIVVDSAIWLTGYVSMWIAKLALTSIFTGENGFADGYKAFAGRIGISKQQDVIEYYSPLTALKKVYEVVFIDRTGLAIAVSAAVILLIALVILKKKSQFSFRAMVLSPVFIIAGFLPFLWFVVAAQPTSMHAWFQYRSIAVFYWAMGAMLSMGFYSASKALQD